MPVRNESDFIDRSLTAVLDQEYPADRMEVLVIDGGSTDDTRARVRRLAEARPEHTISLLDNPRGIAPTALNLGLGRAKGSVVVRVDGHCEISPQYISNGVAHLESGAADGVGGVLETVTSSATATAIAIGMASRFGVGGSAFRTAHHLEQPRVVDTVAFPAYTRQAIARAGGFDEELVRNQDDEYNYRLRRSGGRILLVPDMPARYYSRATLRSLGRQFFQYGMWKVRVLQKHPLQMKPRQFAPAILVGSVLGSSVWAATGSRLGLAALVSVAGLYVLAALGFALFTRPTLLDQRSGGWRSRLRLPAVFATLHFSYGVGFLFGLVRFAGRWTDRKGAEPRLTRPVDR